MRIEVTQGGQTNSMSCKHCGSEDLGQPAQSGNGIGASLVRIKATCNTCGNISKWQYTNPSLDAYPNPQPDEGIEDSISCDDCGRPARAIEPYKIAQGKIVVAYRCEGGHTYLHKYEASQP